MTSVPLSANANIVGDLFASISGKTASAGETEVIESDGTECNSQTMPLLESSVNPDLKNTNEPEDIVIVQDDSFIYNEGLFGVEAKYEKSPLSDQIYVYTVEEGDTLSEIADTFGVSPNTIRWENNLSGNNISVGKKLNILPVTGVKHIVKSGDTISKIAAKYEAESEDIYIFNDISKDSVLKQGDIIFVPNGVMVASVSKVTSSGSGTTVSSNTKVQSGFYKRPVSGRITSSYGSRKGGFHYGIDLAGARGTPVYAAASGVVIKAVTGCVEGKKSCGGRYGNYIVIEHENGTSTLYAHLSKVNVSVGQTVSQSKKIGAVGSTGGSTGPHLHFEIRKANGSTMKPPF